MSVTNVMEFPRTKGIYKPAIKVTVDPETGIVTVTNALEVRAHFSTRVEMFDYSTDPIEDSLEVVSQVSGVYNDSVEIKVLRHEDRPWWRGWAVPTLTFVRKAGDHASKLRAWFSYGREDEVILFEAPMNGPNPILPNKGDQQVLPLPLPKVEQSVT